MTFQNRVRFLFKVGIGIWIYTYRQWIDLSLFMSIFRAFWTHRVGRYLMEVLTLHSLSLIVGKEHLVLDEHYEQKSHLRFRLKLGEPAERVWMYRIILEFVGLLGMVAVRTWTRFITPEISLGNFRLCFWISKANSGISYQLQQGPYL